jgi:hypothetical protein
VPLRKIAIARLMSPFVIGCVDSFREAYSRTGMNLAQSIVMFVVAIGQHGWRRLSGRKSL